MDKASLLSNRLGEREFPVRGGSIKLRGMTRDEVVAIRELSLEDTPALECAVLSASLIDPALTPDEVAEWRKVAPAGEIERALSACYELSSLGGDDSETERQFRND